MTHESTDDSPDYYALYSKLSDELSEPDQRKAEIRLVVRQEVERIVLGLIGCAAVLAGVVVAVIIWGWWGLVAWPLLGIVWLTFGVLLERQRPGAERHRIASEAEDCGRLQIVAETYRAGEPVWRVETDKYDGTKRIVGAADNARWEAAWERFYKLALEFLSLSPSQRKQRLQQAKKDARPALNQGAALADSEGAELIFWARW
jgi:hypothetical protein